MTTYRNATVALFVATVMALLAPRASASQYPFEVTTVQSSGTAILDITDAENLIDGKIAAASTTTSTYDLINFKKASDPAGKFAGAVPFPGIPSNNVQNFAVEATANVLIPAPGNYTFGVSSDDGFSLTVGSFHSSYPGQRKAEETYATFNFTKAGSYPVDLVYFQHLVAAELEFFAAPGKYSSFNTSFRLVGDTSNGGLALTSAISPTGSGTPEPTGPAMMLAPLAMFMLRRPRRINSSL